MAWSIAYWYAPLGEEIAEVLRVPDALPADRSVLNAEWTKMFPDPESRPARHTQAAPDGPYFIQLDFTAVL